MAQARAVIAASESLVTAMVYGLDAMINAMNSKDHPDLDVLAAQIDDAMTDLEAAILNPVFAGSSLATEVDRLNDRIIAALQHRASTATN